MSDPAAVAPAHPDRAAPVVMGVETAESRDLAAADPEVTRLQAAVREAGKRTSRLRWGLGALTALPAFGGFPLLHAWLVSAGMRSPGADSAIYAALTVFVGVLLGLLGVFGIAWPVASRARHHELAELQEELFPLTPEQRVEALVPMEGEGAADTRALVASLLREAREGPLRAAALNEVDRALIGNGLWTMAAVQCGANVVSNGVQWLISDGSKPGLGGIVGFWFLVLAGAALYQRYSRRRLLRSLDQLSEADRAALIQQLAQGKAETRRYLKPMLRRLGASLSEVVPAAPPGGDGHEASPSVEHSLRSSRDPGIE